MDSAHKTGRIQSGGQQKVTSFGVRLAGSGAAPSTQLSAINGAEIEFSWEAPDPAQTNALWLVRLNPNGQWASTDINGRNKKVIGDDVYLRYTTLQGERLSDKSFQFSAQTAGKYRLYFGKVSSAENWCSDEEAMDVELDLQAQTPVITPTVAASGTLQFDNSAPMAGKPVALRYQVTGCRNGTRLSLSISPDPKDGSNGRRVLINALGMGQVSLTAPSTNDLYTYTLLIDGAASGLATLDVGVVTPSIQISSPLSHSQLIAGQTIDIGWSITDFQIGQSVMLQFAPDPDSLSVGAADAQAAEGFLTIAPEAQGVFVLTASVIDAAGNAYASSPVTISIAAAPTPKLDEITGPIELGSSAHLSWSAIPGFSKGMSIKLSCAPDPEDSHFKAAGQDVTTYCDRNGSGALSVIPTKADLYTFSLQLFSANGQAIGPLSSQQVTADPDGGYLFSPHLELSPADAPPRIEYFVAAPYGSSWRFGSEHLAATTGSTIVLAWEVSGEIASLKIDNGVGDVAINTTNWGENSGSGQTWVSFQPGKGPNATYTLTLKPKDPAFPVETAQVFVSPLVGADPRTILKIDFSATPNKKVARGTVITLDWKIIGDVDQASIVGVWDRCKMRGSWPINTNDFPPDFDTGNYTLNVYKNGEQIGSATAHVELEDNISGIDTIEPGKQIALNQSFSLTQIPELGEKIASALTFTSNESPVSVSYDMQVGINGFFVPARTVAPQTMTADGTLQITQAIIAKANVGEQPFVSAQLSGAADAFEIADTDSGYLCNLYGALTLTYGGGMSESIQLTGLQIRPSLLTKGGFSITGPQVTRAITMQRRFNGEIELPIAGTVDAMISISGQTTVEPNWKMLIGEALKNTIKRLLQEAGVEVIGDTIEEGVLEGLAGGLAGLALGGLIVYGLLQLVKEIDGFKDMLSGYAEAQAMKKWLANFRAAMRFDPMTETDAISEDGYAQGGTLQANVFKQYSQSQAVQAWVAQLETDPGYQRRVKKDPLTKIEFIKNSYIEAIDKRMLDILAKADAQVHASMHHSLFNSYCDQYSNDVTCMQVFFAFWPRRTFADDWKWLPADVYQRASANGWLNQPIFLQDIPPSPPPPPHVLSRREFDALQGYCSDFQIVRAIPESQLVNEAVAAGVPIDPKGNLIAEENKLARTIIIPLTKDCDEDLCQVLGGYVQSFICTGFLIGARFFSGCVESGLELRVEL